jgi:leucine dehydrogenase
MDIFDAMVGAGHERVLVCSNPEAGLRAIIAVHSTRLGPGLGGVRMWPYASTEEALTDALRLSRGMTYKAAAAGLHLGGAKAVIVGDPKRARTEALLRAFGRCVESLGGDYITAEDVGTDAADMEMIGSETRWVTGLPADRGGSGDPSPVTARGVHQGMRAVAVRLWDTPSLAGRSVAVQGLGSVGGHLARSLVEEGAKVFACDIDPDAAEAARTELGVEIVPAAEIYEVECDVFAPCALGAVLNERTIPRLRVRAIAGAANNQLAEEERDGLELHRRGMLYAPDFLINAGGLINVYNELIGYHRERALRMADGIHSAALRVFDLAERERLPTFRAAERLAEERLAAVGRLGPRHWERLARERLSARG